MEMRFSDDFLKALEFSRDEAVRTGWHNISPDHIMLGILRLEDCVVFDVLGCAGVPPFEFKAALDDAVFVEEEVPWDERDSVVLSDGARSFLEHACLEARRCGSAVVEPLHFVLAACRVAGPYCHDYLNSCQVSLRSLVEAAGIKWEDYRLDRPVRPEPDKAPVPDPQLMADAIERRLREGYSTGIIHVS